MRPAALDLALRTDVAYFLHAVGPDGPARDANIARALRWFEWLIEVTDLQILAPWLPYVLALKESTHRARGMHDGARIIARTSLRVGFVCGSVMSKGCDVDVATLRQTGVGVIDLTPLGLDLPPANGPEVDADWRAALAGLVDIAAPPDVPRWDSRPPIVRVQAINSHKFERPWV